MKTDAGKGGAKLTIRLSVGRKSAFDRTLLGVQRNAARRKGDRREHENPAYVTGDQLWEFIGTALTTPSDGQDNAFATLPVVVL